MLFSSHILEEVERIAGNIQVMVAGRHAASGGFREIRRLMTERPHQCTIRSDDDRALAAAIMFLLLAVLTRHAVVVGLLYALIWETLVGNFVPGAQTLSIQQWGLAITEKVVGPDAQQLGVTSAVSLGAAVPLLLVVIIGSTWYAGWRLRSLCLTSDE